MLCPAVKKAYETNGINAAIPHMNIHMYDEK